MLDQQYLGALHIQKLLQESGFQTLACGGYVRDFLLNIPYDDIDLSTQATPEQIEDILLENDIYTMPIGNGHGTLIALYNDYEYEITTLSPATTFEEDSKRRDFTVNALYMDLQTNQIYDYVNGQEDIKNKILRFVGNAEDRIKEDYLRLLRVFRFEAQLGFEIEVESEQTALRYRHYLEFISIERIKKEFFKMLNSKFLANIFAKSTGSEILFQIIPVLRTTEGFHENNENYRGYILDHLVDTTVRLIEYKNPVLSLAGLTHDIARPFCSTIHEDKGAWVGDKLGKKLKLSNDEIHELVFLIQNHHRIQNCKYIKDYRALIKDCSFGENVINNLIDLTLADIEDSNESLKNEVKIKIDKLRGLLCQQ